MFISLFYSIYFYLFVRVFDTTFPADTGMWIITEEDVESLRGSSGGAVDVHQPLAAPTGLYFQPYCASVPMPPEIISRCISSKTRHRVFKR
jgi:hypothetical protein